MGKVLQVTNYMIITKMLKMATALSITDKNILNADYSIENDDRSIRTNVVISFIEENIYETPI